MNTVPREAKDAHTSNQEKGTGWREKKKEREDEVRRSSSKVWAVKTNVYKRIESQCASGKRPDEVND